MASPKLRFKEFHGDWAKSKLGSQAQFIQGEQVSLDDQFKEYAEGLTKFLRIENFTQNSKDFRYIEYTGSKEKILTEKDIAIVRYGATAGFICSGVNGVIANNLFKVVVDSETIDQKYIELVLKSEKTFNYFQAEMAGGAMPALNFKIVGNLDITYPPKEEQTKIASFLSTVDEKISQLARKHELLIQYKKGMMQKLFSQQMRFKADEGSEFGEWETLKFKDLINIKYGKDHKKLGDGNIPVLGTGGIMRYVDSYLYDGESILIGRKGTINKPQFISGKFWTVDTLFYTEIDKKILPKFAFQQLLLVNWLNLNEATGVPSLNTSSIGNIEIKVPCLEEQTKIANFLSAIDQKIEVVAKQIEQAKQWKKGLLQQMFV